MNYYWFKPWKWLYLPISLPGLMIVVMAAIFCIQVFYAVDKHSHSASDTLYGVFPYFACCFLLFDWLARRTSKPIAHQDPDV
jgi:hypothetical protein